MQDIRSEKPTTEKISYEDKISEIAKARVELGKEVKAKLHDEKYGAITREFITKFHGLKKDGDENEIETPDGKLRLILSNGKVTFFDENGKETEFSLWLKEKKANQLQQ